MEENNRMNLTETEIELCEKLEITEETIMWFGKDHVIVDMALEESHEVRFPYIRITLLTGRDVFLIPFRGYCFMVNSGIKEGSARGQSRVVGLGNILNAEFHKSNDDYSIYYSNQGDLRITFLGLLQEEALRGYYMVPDARHKYNFELRDDLSRKVLLYLGKEMRRRERMLSREDA